MSNKLAGGIKAGSTSVSLPIELRSSTDSTETTGKVYTDVTAYYWRQGGTATSITAATLSGPSAAYSSGGFVEVDSTHMKGVYRFDVPDAAFATGADFVVVSVTVSGCFVESFMFALERVGVNDIVDSSNRIDVGKFGGTSVTARDIGASVLLSNGTGTGQISLSSGAVTAGTVSDKTGYALTSAYDAAKTAAQAGDVMKVSSGTGANQISLSSGAVTVGTNSDKTGYSLTQSFPSNFASMAINASGHVILQDASLVTAKLGTFALAKGTNITGFNDIAATAIVSSGAITTSGGAVSTVTTVGTLTTNSDKTGYSLSVTPPTASQIKDAVWNEPQSGHTTTGTFGKYLDAQVSTISGGGGGGFTDDDRTTLNTIADTVAAGSGSGAYSITVTVTDGTSPLQNARVRVTEGADTFTATTDASGNASFSLDAATYAVAVTKSGYSFTPTTRTVTGDQAGTLTSALAMTQIAITGPSDPSLCVVYADCITPEGDVAKGIDFEFTLLQPSPSSDGSLIANRRVRTETDDEGHLSVELIRTDTITPTGSRWQVYSKALKLSADFELTSASFDIGSLI